MGHQRRDGPGLSDIDAPVKAFDVGSVGADWLYLGDES